MSPDAFKYYCVYQIYPASFTDANGDGVGDLAGIRSKLEYIKGLGVDVIWLSPIYRSPQKDMGYDISDYQDIDPNYGTLEDWDSLLKETQKLGMREYGNIIMDLVVNHTSDQHAWFKESRSSKSNTKRDWYIWRPPKFDAEGNRKPPNNWAGHFGGSVWEWNETTQEYYLHLYATEQPDLDWENPEVRQEVWKIMRWWMDKGCDGFRMDIINLISKVPGLPDVPVTRLGQYYQPGTKYYCNGPHVHEYMQEMYREVPSLSIHARSARSATVRTARTQGAPNDVPVRAFRHRQAILIPAHESISKMARRPACSCSTTVDGTRSTWKITIKPGRSPDSLGIWTGSGVLEPNYSRSYILLRVGLCSCTKERKSVRRMFEGSGVSKSTRMLRPLTFIARSSSFARGLVWASRICRMSWMESIARHETMHVYQCRYWDDSLHAGFTNGTPWMRVNDNYKQINAKNQVDNEHSVFSFWKKMIVVRKAYPLLVHGDFDHTSCSGGREYLHVYPGTQWREGSDCDELRQERGEFRVA
ncbi:hypothetical protein RSAG8_04303, partial [Rhizoctonia solani AG-8 WAC10335]